MRAALTLALLEFLVIATARGGRSIQGEGDGTSTGGAGLSMEAHGLEAMHCAGQDA